MNHTVRRGAATLANWREHPNSQYGFQHAGEFVPTAQLAAGCGSEPPSPGPGLLATARVRRTGADGTAEAIAPVEHLQVSHADQLVVMRDGELAAEWLAPHADPALPHLVFSISKSVTGLLTGIAAGDGMLDPDDAVTDHVPSMRGSAYGDARVRDLLDMTVDLDFDEEYLDAGGAFDRYRRAMLWNPERASTPQETMEGFLSTLERRGGTHGTRFFYASPNSDLLGLVVERAAGMRYHEFLARRLLAPLGARGAACVTVDRVGTARAAGGICLTARDLARLGQLVLDGGRAPDGTEIVPGAWIDDMRSNGDRQAWVDGNFADLFADGRYRSGWYDVGDGRGTIAAIGIHGQWLWIDPPGRVVIARTSSRPAPSDDAANAREIEMMEQIAGLFETD